MLASDVMHMDMSLKACEAVANSVHALSQEVAMVEKAMSAVSIVLRSLKLGADDGILVTSLMYPACHNAAKAVCKDTGAKLNTCEIRFPQTHHL